MCISGERSQVHIALLFDYNVVCIVDVYPCWMCFVRHVFLQKITACPEYSYDLQRKHSRKECAYIYTHV